MSNGFAATNRALSFRRNRYQVSPAVEIKLEARDADAVRHTVFAQTDNQLRFRLFQALATDRDFKLWLHLRWPKQQVKLPRERGLRQLHACAEEERSALTRSCVGATLCRTTSQGCPSFSDPTRADTGWACHRSDLRAVLSLAHVSPPHRSVHGGP